MASTVQVRILVPKAHLERIKLEGKLRLAESLLVYIF